MESDLESGVEGLALRGSGRVFIPSDSVRKKRAGSGADATAAILRSDSVESDDLSGFVDASFALSEEMVRRKECVLGRALKPQANRLCE